MTRLRAEDAQRRLDAGVGPDFSEALARGLQVLKVFDSAKRQMTLSEIAQAVDLPRATARRSLHTLRELGYVASEGRMFRLTPRVLELASAYLKTNSLTEVIQPVCEKITGVLGEICSAAVFDRGEAVTVARALPPQLGAVGIGIGFRLPAYCSSLGRVLLASLPKPDLETFLSEVDLAPLTRHTITSRAQLRKEIASVRRAGFSYADQESEYGYRSIAVPLHRATGGVAAAMHLGARIERVSAERMLSEYKDLLLAEADRLSSLLI
jgi:IclR family pca regulon transcriptional regulator